MVDVIGRAKVIITGDVDSRSVDASGKKIGTSLRAGAAVGVAALGTLAVAGVKAFQAFEEAEAQSRKLNTVLTNMGESQAAPAVEKLADELMKLTGIDDEVIKGGQTILATFDSVNDSAGVMGGTFDRATRAAVDMSAIFGSVESASRAVGKALEDPEKAATLLRRANVFLNEEQKTLIDNFVAAGDSAGAQDVILDALEDRYKGTAESAATESQKISTAFGELKENAGAAIAELVSGEDGSVGSLSTVLFDLSDQVGELAKSDDWADLGSDLRTVGAAGKFLWGWADKLVSKVPGLGEALGDLAAGPIWGSIDKLADLAEAAKDAYNWLDKLGGELDGNSGTIIDDNGRTDLGDSDFIKEITSASGGRIPAGLRLVGENGPEVISMGSGGGYVHNNSETRAMMGGGGTINYSVVNYGPVSGGDILAEMKWASRFAPRFGANTASVAG